MLIDKDNLPMVAVDLMNEIHVEDVDIINELFELILNYEREPNQANQELIDQKYQAWYDHTVAHFRFEEMEMQELAFPAYPFHKSEHDKALAMMYELFEQWQQSRDITLLKHYFIEVLPTWLTQHIQTMDTVTAMFFKTGLSPCSV
ncbi:MAG TPA: hypothetical protein ENK86_06110 [Campylobacterales bacterium]|nr:hypothetical protein [Campylobacterales bacterium]